MTLERIAVSGTRAGYLRRPPVAGAASLGLRGTLDGPGRPARVIAVFPSAVYVQLHSAPEPQVLGLVSSDAARLPNSIVIAATSRDRPFKGLREGASAWVGDECVAVGALRVRNRRWWDPSPPLGPISRARLAQGLRFLAAAVAHQPCGLDGHPGPPRLAGHCAAGDLASAVEVADQIVGLGPGLTPSGDDILAGLVVSLRLVGRALRHGESAVWLAGWLSAAVTAHADTRTTSLAASLLHCAARGQASGEVGAVLRAVAGHEPPYTAVQRLLALGHTSGADLAWGVLAGCRAALALSATTIEARRITA